MYGKKPIKTVKDCNVNTPIWLSDFIAEIIMESELKDRLLNGVKVFDSCMGGGNMLAPYEKKGIETWGVDIRGGGENCIKTDFLDWKGLSWENEIKSTALVVQNPPFNLTKINDGAFEKRGNRRPLLPELFLDKTWEIFGKEIPCVCIVPMGMRLNQRLTSKRFRHMRDNYPEISSIITLPLDVFEANGEGLFQQKKVLIHSEVLIFNVKNIKPHYFLPEKYIERRDVGKAE